MAISFPEPVPCWSAVGGFDAAFLQVFIFKDFKNLPMFYLNRPLFPSVVSANITKSLFFLTTT